MKKTVEFYHFSPTGGTKKVGETLAHALGEVVSEWDLGGSLSKRCKNSSASDAGSNESEAGCIKGRAESK